MAKHLAHHLGPNSTLGVDICEGVDEAFGTCDVLEDFLDTCSVVEAFEAVCMRAKFGL